MLDHVFEAKNLTKRYGSYLALDNVSLAIRSGEIYGLVGENGAGKTTLMKVIGSLVSPCSGSVFLFGGADRRKEKRRQVGYLIEMPALYHEMSARDNLEFFCRVLDISDKRAIDNVLREVDLVDTGAKKAGDFSFGMRQRLGLAVALLNDPVFLVLDEPINGLDPSGIAAFREIITRRVREKGAAVLISSHILSELELLATRFGFIHKGRLLKEISAQELTVSDEKHICIQVSNPVLAAELLQNAFRIQAAIREDRGEICVSSKEISIEDTISTLIGGNIQILNVSVTSPSLEDYYFNIIRGNVE